MEEILKNGPVVMNIAPKFDFMYYYSGIYHSQPADWILKNEKKPDWVITYLSIEFKQQVDHSVLCYGWGEENGEKFWYM
jgi:cathepsin C